MNKFFFASLPSSFSTVKHPQKTCFTALCLYNMYRVKTFFFFLIILCLHEPTLSPNIMKSKAHQKAITVECMRAEMKIFYPFISFVFSETV